jgi:hypothetical protein
LLLPSAAVAGIAAVEAVVVKNPFSVKLPYVQFYILCHSSQNQPKFTQASTTNLHSVINPLNSLYTCMKIKSKALHFKDDTHFATTIPIYQID